MILSYKWLSELLDIPVSPSELADVLSYLGLDVEAVHHYRPSLENVVIGKVVECSRVEGTEHLSITKTDVGGQVLSIVCGAPNARAGMNAVVMLSGSTTADGRKIKKTKLRGFESEGMLASEVELGISDASAGILEVEASWKIGAPASDYLNLPDTTYDVEVTPNRPDFLSHVGVARDLAAKFKIPWRWPVYEVKESGDEAAKRISVEIQAPDACPRYAARVVDGIKIAPSPYEIRLRLTRCGIRPISNIVDVTNYLMLEFGQPLHAFDARFIEGNKICIRKAKLNEKFVTLDNKSHELTAGDLLIADANKGVALAGVMGGLNSEIRDDTQSVVIECAYFDPVSIRRTAKTHGMSTDSSRRFERGMDPNGVPRVADAAAVMMQRLGGGTILKGIVDAYPTSTIRKTTSFRPTRTTSVIGMQIPKDEMKDILSRLDCEVKDSGESWTISMPTHRPDLEREIDLIEEVIRVHGYDKLTDAISSRVALQGEDDSLWSFRRRVEDIFVGLGFLQTVSVSMSNPDERKDPPNTLPGVALANPVTDEMMFLHGSVLPSLVKAAAANWQRGNRDLRLFEATRVFRQGEPKDPRTWERQIVAGLITGQSYPEGWAHVSKSFDFFDLKGILDALCAKISLDKHEIYCYDIESGGLLRGEVRSDGISYGNFGIWPRKVMAARDLDAAVGWFELDLQQLKKCSQLDFQYQPLPRFPLAWRDIAVVVDRSKTASDLEESIRQAGGEYLVGVRPFDLYEGEKLGADKKSLAFRIEFLHADRSLADDEVDRWMATIVNQLQSDHSAHLR